MSHDHRNLCLHNNAAIVAANKSNKIHKEKVWVCEQTACRQQYTDVHL